MKLQRASMREYVTTVCDRAEGALRMREALLEREGGDLAPYVSHFLREKVRFALEHSLPLIRAQAENALSDDSSAQRSENHVIDDWLRAKLQLAEPVRAGIEHLLSDLMREEAAAKDALFVKLLREEIEARLEISSMLERHTMNPRPLNPDPSAVRLQFRGSLRLLFQRIDPVFAEYNIRIPERRVLREPEPVLQE